MPLFSDHISNIYYSGSPLYSSSSYGYNSSVLPLGSSYSASYLNPGGNYSNHSSLGSYSRTPLTSRWISGVGRSYSPMLSTISERSAASPVRINSPRRIPITKRSYGSSGYITRPININTADIDVSKDKYRKKAESPVKTLPQRKESPRNEKEKENSPFMPRVDGKPETGIDSSPGVPRSTIKRGRTVVRLHTIRRKDRDSPRKPVQSPQTQEKTDKAVEKKPEDLSNVPPESTSWREKLSDDLIYKVKKEKKSLGTKLAEKFMFKDTYNEDSPEKAPVENNNLMETEVSQNLPVIPIPGTSKSPDRRCSLEILAEQAKLFDSLIRKENLSTAPLDLSKVGVVVDQPKDDVISFGPIKRRKSNDKHNPLKTTQSDHSLHDTLKSAHGFDTGKKISKRRSLKKSSSGGNICRLDSITEFPKEPLNINLPAIDETKPEATVVKPKPKLKTKITASVEVTPPKSPLKFRIDDVVVEEKPRIIKKGITFSSMVDEIPTQEAPILKKESSAQNQKNTKKILQPELPSPEPEDGNFWNKIGKRETIYLTKRKQLFQEAKEKHKQPFFWLPEEETFNQDESEPNMDCFQLDSKINSTSVIDDNNISENKTSSVKSSTDGNILCDNLSVTLPKKSDKITLINNQVIETPLKEEELKNPEAKGSQSIKQQVSKNDHVSINKQIQTLDQKENILYNEILKNSSHSKDSAMNKEIIKGSQEENILKAKELKDIIPIKDDSIRNKKTKVSTLKYQVSTTAKAKESTTKEDSQKNKDTYLKDNLKKKETKQSSQKEERSLNIEDAKQLSHEEKEVELICSTEEKPAMSVGTISAEELKSHIKILKQNTIVDKDKRKHEENNGHDPTTDTLSKIETNTKLNETEEQGSKVNLEKNNAEKLSEMTEDDKKCKPTKEKGLEYKTNSTPTKLKISKKKDSSEKSASNKICEKKTSTKSPTHLPKESEVIKDSKMTEQDNLKSSCNKTDQNVKARETTEEHNITLLSEDLQQSILLCENIMQKQKEFLSSPLEDCNAISFNGDSVSSCNNISNIQVAEEVSENIPLNENKLKSESAEQKGEETKSTVEAESVLKKDEQDVKPIVETAVKLPDPPSAKKLVKQEAALRPLIATPRPLQKRPPQVIHSSESSDSSSEEETSDEEDDECEASEGSEEFFECEANPDGRTSTGSNDSGFDSSAPTSPAGFQQIGKDCDVNCHRKCEKLTANLCGVNQRLLVEALATRTASKKGADVPGTASSIAVHNSNSTDILEQELEQSTAYGIFRKTGRFTPPARSIPRFRKYTIEDFNFIKVLGKGSFGKVLLAELRDTEYYYAVKCLKKDVVLEDDDVECTLIERKVLALGTNHPYLCHLFATFQTDSHLFFVMEYLNGGDLMFHIQQSGRFPEARARFYAAEIVSGLKFLHKRGIIYRDLKLDNILLDFDGHVRIADFGMCKLQIYLDKTADTFCGTPDYMAPEIIKGLKYNQTVDWWSFGVLLYEMLIGQSPFSGCDEDELFWSICNEMPSYPRFLSQEALTILTRLLDKDARTRLGGTECMHGDIREQAFFHAIHWDRLERRDLEAPFRPRVRHPLDTQYFDRAFTGERPRLTAVEPQVLRSMDQEPFRGFSYTNPNATDR